MNEQSEFIQSHLDRVSRSFAFCIRQLPEPLRGWVGVGYLLCRIIDTIEDSDFSDSSVRMKAFDWFDSSLTHLSAEKGFYNYPMDLYPVSVTPGEELLLKDADRVFQIFWSVDAPVRKNIADLAESMSKGMKHFRVRSPGPLKLENLKEVNQYCFFVAGLVGEMLVHFVAQVEPRFQLDLSKVMRAHHFGLFLQKVNLLKDQLKDQKLGRFLVPSREDVESSAEENAMNAIDFLAEVPMEQMEFRRFCAWSLFLGLQSLKTPKLTRQRTEAILMEVEENLHDNNRLQALYKKFSSALGWSKQYATAVVNGAPAASDWILDLYKGRLESKSLHSLGLT